MKHLVLLIVVIMCLGVVVNVGAQEKKWSDEAELAFVDSSGNTDTTSLLAKNKLKYQFTNALSGTWKVGALYGETDGETSAERYQTELRGDYLFTERFYGVLLGGWQKDRFEGIDAKYYVGPSLGYKFLIGPVHFLNCEAGVNYTFEEYTDGSDESFVKGRTFGEYEYRISEKTKFKQALEMLFDVEDVNNYEINSETAFIASINDRFSLKTGYVVEYDNEPSSSDVEKTDRYLSVTLVVGF